MDVSKVKSGQVQESRTQTQNQVAKTKSAGLTAPVVDAGDISGIKQDIKSSEKVEFSPEAQMSKEAFQIARNTPDVRADKVKELKDAIRNGSYKVDSKALADKMLQGSLEDSLLSSAKM